MMPTEPSPPHEDLFYEELIRSYVEAPRFIGRPWLAKQIEEAFTDPSCHFLLLTAAPGAGKTAFLAWLAHQHASWPRYFIRRDQRTPLGDVGAHSLLLQIGFQLAASYPVLFERKQLQVMIEQRIGEVSSSGEAIAADIDKMFATPFYQMVVQIKQQVERNNGKVTGIHIGEWITDPRPLSLSTLQNMALLDPARVILKEFPEKLLVILIDALDEMRYQDPEQTLLSWLSTCPELPANVRFVLTSRPDEALLARFRGAQQPWLKEMTIEATDPNIQLELRTYALKLTLATEVKAVLEADGKKVEDFVNQAAEWARGNIGVLDAAGRAIDQVMLQPERFQPDRQTSMRQLLDLKQLPNTLEGLYAFFLHQIKEIMTKDDKSIAVKDENGKVHYLSPWPTVYLPILSILTVAREPLTALQIQILGTIQAGWGDLCEAMDALRQFLNRRGENYFLYHATLIEFLTDQKTQQNPETRDLYLDEREWHRNIAMYYRRTAAETGWDYVESYGLRYVIQHLNLAHEWQQLFVLLDELAFGRAKLRFDPSARSYALDLDLGRQATIWEGWTIEEGMALLPRLWQYTLLRCSLTSRAVRYPEEAFQLLILLGRKQEALGLAELLTNQTRKVQVLQRIAEQLRQQSSEGFEWLEIFMRVGDVAQTIQDIEEQSGALRELGTALAQAQQWDQAERVISTIQDSHEQSRALCALGTALAQAGQQKQASQVWDQAERVISTIQDSGWDTGQTEVALYALGAALAQAGQWAEAERVIRTIQDSFHQAGALHALGTILAQVGQQEQASQVWAGAERIIGMIQYLDWGSVQDGAMHAQDTALKQAEQWAEAEHLIGTLQDSDLQALALNDLTTKMTRTGNLEQVLHVIQRSWRQVETSGEAKALFPMVSAIISYTPDIGTAFFSAFSWVDNILGG